MGLERVGSEFFCLCSVWQKLHGSWLYVRCRIRERRKLQIIESREKRKVEKPRLPRTAKKIQAKKMEAELGQIGLEIELDEDVCIHFVCSIFVVCLLVVSEVLH